MIAELTLTMRREDDYWVGECVQLGLVTSGHDHWEVWQDLFNVCGAQMSYAVEHDLTERLILKGPGGAMTRELAQALLLLHGLDDVCTERRRLEGACGYPREYGGDDDLLAATRAFLATKPEWSFEALKKWVNEREGS